MKPMDADQILFINQTVACPVCKTGLLRPGKQLFKRLMDVRCGNPSCGKEMTLVMRGGDVIDGVILDRNDPSKYDHMGVFISPRSTPMWIVCFNPSDYPGRYTVRVHVVTGQFSVQDSNVFVCQTLEEAREHVPKGATLLARHPDDDSVIVETWI